MESTHSNLCPNRHDCVAFRVHNEEPASWSFGCSISSLSSMSVLLPLRPYYVLFCALFRCLVFRNLNVTIQIWRIEGTTKSENFLFFLAATWKWEYVEIFDFFGVCSVWCYSEWIFFFEWKEKQKKAYTDSFFFFVPLT